VSSPGAVKLPETAAHPEPADLATRAAAPAADTEVPSQRTGATGDDFGATVAGVEGTAPGMTQASPRAPAAPRTRRLDPRLLLALAGLAVVLVVAAVVLAGGGDDGEDQSSSPTSAAVGPATKLPADLAWQPLRDAPFRRQYAAATAVDGRVWVFGGVGVKTSSTTSKAYDLDADSWTTGPGLPLALHHFMAVTYEGEAVVIGGFVPGEELTSQQSDRVFALRDGAWEELPPLNHARAAAAAAVVGDKIVVVGGQANGKLVPQTEVFDGESWKDVAEIPTPREHLGAASDGRYLYAVGGRELSADNNLRTLERYDPASDRWTELDSMPMPSGSVGAAYAGGRLVTVGGENSTSASDAVQGYDIQKRQWSKLPDLPSARHGVAVAALDDSLYAIGGAAVPGHVESTKSVEVLDLSGASTARPTAGDLEWHAVREAPFPRQYATSTAVGGRVWLFGGIGEDESASAETAAYDRAIDTWTTGPQLPQALHHFMAVTYKGEAVVMGGFVPGDELTSEQSDRVYALREGTWEELPRLNHARAAAAAAVVGNRIVVVGGQAGGKLVRQTEVFDGTRWRDGAAIPTPREHLGAASDGRYLYAVGGRELSADNNLGTLERYDPAKDRWTELDGMPTVTGSVGAAFVAGRLVTIGGESSTNASDSVQAYDVQAQQWSELPNLPSPRHGVAVTALADSLYAIGGAATAGHVESTSVTELLDFD
jgi:non-specific serine/threonine protein kinase